MEVVVAVVVVYQQEQLLSFRILIHVFQSRFEGRPSVSFSLCSKLTPSRRQLSTLPSIFLAFL
jgi:hypothetical protein